jgi:acyl transferase domain-containing protein/NAD(P)-dependent dehydrogenase (short-subunit alcohol dehydrogenase family)/acyl carrier protein
VASNSTGNPLARLGSDKKRQETAPLAIVGIGCRFPGGGNTPETFWNLLRDGVDTLGPVPPKRWDATRFTDADGAFPGTAVNLEAGFIAQDIEHFDADFFGVAPREAARLDPQQRLLLETTWEALEDAGIPADGLAGEPVGVYVGGFTTDSLLHQLSDLNRDDISPQTATSATLGMLANRVSFLFDFTGPSITIDTACSSSLVALNYACRDLWQGECSLALAAGVNVMFKPEYSIAMTKGGFLSPGSRSKAFDSRADGYARGEGAGVVAIKPLDQAQADGDRIYAVIRGTGVNQDGRTSGITVPNRTSQEKLIRHVYDEFDIDPSHITYVEAHGTGTPVGDPIESTALGTVLRESHSGGAPRMIGSVKANIGHLEAAAGIAGTIKSALVLSHRQVPPQIHVLEANPEIPFDDLHLRIPQALEALPRNGSPACVSINSFGFGGTNAHAVLQEPPVAESGAAESGAPEIPTAGNTPGAAHLMTLSARSPDALRDLAATYDALLADGADDATAFARLCHAMAVRRAHHRNRLAVAGDRDQIRNGLRAFLAGEPGSDTVTGDAAQEVSPVFVFTGMGPQWWAMGRELLAQEPVFEKAARDADNAFRACAGWSILDAMLADEETSRMATNEIAQPANFIIQVGLFALWKSWGITPAAIIGHSVGEVAAAYAAGCLSLEDAARISFHRSQCQQTVAGQGTMLAVGLNPETAAELVALYPGRASVASINSPSSVAIAGDRETLQEIADNLTDEGVFNRFLRVEVAYHSHQMDPLEQDLKSKLEGLAPKPPAIPLYSTVTGSRVTTALHDAEYWWRNVRQPVRFRDAAASAVGDGHALFVEVGPHPVLSAALKETAAAQGEKVEVLHSLKRGDEERRTALRTLARLYCLGHPVNWPAFYGDRCPHLALPLYPWQRERHWFETEKSTADRLPIGGDVLLGQAIPGPGSSWRSALTHNSAPFLWDHMVDGMVVFPGAGYVQMMLAAQRNCSPEAWGVIEDIEFKNAFVLGDSEKPVLETRIDGKDNSVSVSARRTSDSESWSTCATALLSRATPRAPSTAMDLSALVKTMPDEIKPADLYDDLAKRGLSYGPFFRCIRSLRRRDGEVLAEIAAQPSLKLEDDVTSIHATMLDASFQALIAALGNDGKTGSAGAVFVPVAIERFSLIDKVPERVWCHGRLTLQTADAIGGDIVLFDDAGRPLARIDGFRCQAVPRANTAQGGDPLDRWFYRYEWQNTPVRESGIGADGDDNGKWIIVADDTRFADDLAACLDAQGTPFLKVRHGAGFDYDGGDSCRMSLNNPDHWNRLFDMQDGQTVRGITYLGGLRDSLGKDDPTGVTACTVALGLLQNLVAAEIDTPPRLCIVTRGVHSPGERNPDADSIDQYALWGLGRVIMNEHPELRCRLIDFDPGYDDAAINDLASEMLSEDREDEVAIRAGRRFVNRLVRTDLPGDTEPPAEVREATTPFELQIATPGDLSSARFVECARRPPQADEVEFRILGVSLNFKDILKMMGVLSAEIVDGTYFGTSIGMEAVAEIVAVGSGATDFNVGDKLVATLPGGCFRSYATVATKDIHGVPALDRFDTLDLAGMPIAFVTAYYGLHRIAGLQQGERVLLHSASGGVGLAAIQVAQWLGAEIHATAGSDAKRAYLRELGVEHIYDSRSLDFADDIRAATGGKGVDVVLNFLAGEAQEKSVSLLAPFGRFIEIGKRDIDENRGLGLRPFNRNLTFAAVDVDRLLAEKPALFDNLLDEVWDGLRDGRFRPVPATVFPAAGFLDAFKAMQRAEHIGKILVRMDGEALPVVPAKREAPLFRADATYLITGGFGGFGLKVAEWMTGEGACNLVLVGRSGAATEEAKAALDRMANAGVTVLSAALDISDESAVADLVQRIEDDRGLPPLRGVFHAAAVLDDAMLVHLNAERFARVMKAKAEGAWLLHRLTEKMELDYFVLFSSVAALVGNPGQGNYGAANTFLDCLANYRAEQGLPAISINWGALAEVGMAARDPSVEAWLNRVGVKSLAPDLAVAALGRALREKPPQIGIMDVDWERWRQTNPAAGTSPKFSDLMAAAEQAHNAASQFIAELAPLDAEARKRCMIDGLASDLAEVLRLPAERLDIDRPLTDMGIDSLMMVEVQLAIERRVSLEVTVMELSRGLSVTKLADHLLGRLEIESGLSAPEEAGAADTPQPMPQADAVDSMSDSEVEAHLERLLRNEDSIDA